jgi:alkylation response protein AidB-like acyl-CoA dehydrogenase
VRVQLTDEQEFLQESVAGVLAREATFKDVRAWTESNDVAPADVLAARQGWTGIGLEEELGGQGGGVVELAVLAEQLGRAAVPWDRTLAACLVTRLLARADGEEAAVLAAATAEGEQVAVLGVDGRHPLVPPADYALFGDRLSLRARYVLGAGTASEIVVPLEMSGAVTLFATSIGDPGVTVRRREIVDRTRSLADIELIEAPVRSLGELPPAALRSAAAAAAVLVGADALGAAGRLLDLTTQYVVERRQFGVPVGSFQAVKHAAAEMLVGVEGSRSAVQYAAWAVDADADDAVLHASIAKSYACGAAAHVADKALFLHGAIGYTWEHDLQFLFKRAKSDELLYGSPDAHRDLIADQLALVAAEVTEPEPVA